VLETIPSFSPYYPLLSFIEWTSVAVFTLEYIARIISTKNKLGYIFSFFGLLDLVAILPSYLGLANLTYLKAGRTVRVLRFLRILRLSKLARAEHLHGTSKERTMLDVIRLNAGIYLTAIVSGILVLGCLIYIAEGHSSEEFKSIPAGMLWTVKILFGLPFEHVHTAAGMWVFFGVKMTGLLLFGAFTGLIGGMFQNILLGQLKGHHAPTPTASASAAQDDDH